MNSSFKGNLIISFGLSLLLLIISSVASYISITNLLKSSDDVSRTNHIIRDLENVLSTLKDAETGQRGYLLSGDERFLAPYNGTYEKALRLQNNIRINTDDVVQRKDAELLRTLIIQRMDALRELIEMKRQKFTIAASDLEKGKQYMDEVRIRIAAMQNRAEELLIARKKDLTRFSDYTPVLIVIAALLSIIITVVSFIRVNNDFDKKAKLQAELEAKDLEMSRRIKVIQEIANKISSGDYAVRASDEGSDGLGNLSVSLNKMARSLEFSFGQLSEKEWLQAGIAGLNDKMLGEKDINTLSEAIVDYVTTYADCQIGALYILGDDKILHLASGYTLPGNKLRKHISIGEGMVGQAAKDGKIVLLNDVAADNLVITLASGEIKPKSVIAIPLFFERQLKGVLELASTREFSKVQTTYFHAVSEGAGIVINTAQNRTRLQELLEETQSQAEELQVQHRELENMNSELEVQSEKLQASEEELKVQQEELLQANQELEERTRLLEDRNELIVERNLEIQQKAEELSMSTKYKSEFLANMSHELRTPLNSILLLSRLLSENNEQNLSADQVEYAKVIQSSGNGLLSLIDEILDLSKIESGKMELEYSEVPISGIAYDLKAIFVPMAMEKNLDFDVIISEEVPATAETDKLRVEQILKNFISNSLKFTAAGSVKLHVSLPDARPGFIKFSVKDTGIGIPKDKQQLIFEAFQQADGSTRRKYGGTGLGLSISRELAKLLSAEIELQSEVDTGSEFSLYIPVKRPGAVNDIKDKFGSPAVTQIKTDDTPAPVPEVQEKKYISSTIPADIPDDRDEIGAGDQVILIIEDDTNFARSLLEFTRQKKYKGVVAVRGDQGLDFATRFKPVGILLDIQLPVKDGWEVMKELKENPGTRHIPVHMMSSYEVKNKSISSGAVDFINKPVAYEQFQEIFQRIEHVLSKSSKKVLIVEENSMHAKALAYYLETFNVSSEIRNTVQEGIDSLKEKLVDCVILDMGIPDNKSYETLEEVKKTEGLENIPIIIFTGKSLSKGDEFRIRQYADSIVIKTAHSYQRILDEVSLFLHLMEENKKPDLPGARYKKLGALNEVLKGKTVLIADDDVRNIFSLTKALENFQMQVLSAIDGKEAFKLLTENPGVDIVLMDMMMPEMDGYETIRKIREKRKYKNLAIIAVTAKAMTGDREKCINAGASDYITKPVDIDQLLSLLRVWLYDQGQ
jgi:CheY-like chemotaxis protein/CHASE3 domain sensor protein/putative methionine-R-sulfoxide reductase with GAF domain